MPITLFGSSINDAFNQQPDQRRGPGDHTALCPPHPTRCQPFSSEPARWQHPCRGRPGAGAKPVRRLKERLQVRPKNHRPTELDHGPVASATEQCTEESGFSQLAGNPRHSSAVDHDLPGCRPTEGEQRPKSLHAGRSIRLAPRRRPDSGCREDLRWRQQYECSRGHY